MKATKQQLREEIKALRFIGGQMSNICFNCSQGGASELTTANKQIMSELRVKWDAIQRSEK
jgi:hypothetical protein